ncbi:MAG: hypothetical protein HOL05_06835, partial [Nitrospinaceae bacterium]|nr:hypothetical protein [Nitrospinaceae bacterium]
MAQKTRNSRKPRSSSKQRALDDALTVVRGHRNGSAAKAKKSKKQLEIKRIE